MQMREIIAHKRDGAELSEAEIRFWIEHYVAGNIPDYQAAALLMAIYFQGLNLRETVALTLAMRDSGTVMDFSALPGPTADKHSTGGVGDKTTLIVAPLAAAAGLYVAKMSGRGLGHTGGTIDKLESIPGFRTNLSVREFLAQVAEIGLALVSQTGELAPADKLLYALRDVTGTVESAALIAASVMSKKLAMNADILLLDVKYGSGALLKTLPESRELARLMVAIGRAAGKKVTALVTSMEQPLGLAVGNALEVREALDVLANQGPEDLRTLSVALAGEMIYMGGKAATRAEGQEKAAALLARGEAKEKFLAMIRAQGGDTDFDRLPQAPLVLPFPAAATGYITAIDTKQVGLAALALGAGRQIKEAAIDLAAGLVFVHKLGAWVNAGETVAYVHCRDAAQGREALDLLAQAIRIAPQAPLIAPLIEEIV